MQLLSRWTVDAVSSRRPCRYDTAACRQRNGGCSVVSDVELHDLTRPKTCRAGNGSPAHGSMGHNGSLFEWVTRVTGLFTRDPLIHVCRPFCEWGRPLTCRNHIGHDHIGTATDNIGHDLRQKKEEYARSARATPCDNSIIYGVSMTDQRAAFCFAKAAAGPVNSSRLNSSEHRT